LPYFIADGNGRSVLKIYNLSGGLLREIDLEKGYNILEIQALDLWPQGIYFYSVEIDGFNILYDKMILME